MFDSLCLALPCMDVLRQPPQRLQPELVHESGQRILVPHDLVCSRACALLGVFHWILLPDQGFR